MPREPGYAVRILVVDDDESTRQVVTAVLEDGGYEVVTARDGVAALDIVTHRRPDLILLDLRMPTVDGPAFARAYRAVPGPHAPIVILTASLAMETAEHTERIGAGGFIRKPFDVDALLESVALCCGPAPWEIAARAAGGPPAAAGIKAGRDAAVRRQALHRLRALLVEVQDGLDRVRGATHALSVIEAQRRLTPVEMGQARTLRWQTRQLQWELHLLRERFMELREG
jgi:CheY-like chemotaxis protein